MPHAATQANFSMARDLNAWCNQPKGIPLHQRREVSYFLEFPTKEAAGQFGANLIGALQRVQLKPSNDNRCTYWNVIALPIMVPSCENTLGYADQLYELAQQLGGASKDLQIEKLVFEPDTGGQEIGYGFSFPTYAAAYAATKAVLLHKMKLHLTKDGAGDGPYCLTVYLPLPIDVETRGHIRRNFEGLLAPYGGEFASAGYFSSLG